LFVYRHHISLHEKHQQITVLPDFLEIQRKEIVLVLSQTTIDWYYFLGGSCIGATANLYLQLLIP
jgi:hypothetical protein